MFHNIGVCGLIASGKSRVSRILAAHFNYTYVDCDLTYKMLISTDLNFRAKVFDFYKNIDPRCIDTALPFERLNLEFVSVTLFGNDQGRLNYPNLQGLREITTPALNNYLEIAYGRDAHLVIEAAALPMSGIGSAWGYHKMFQVTREEYDVETIAKIIMERNPQSNPIYLRGVLDYQRKQLAQCDVDKLSINRKGIYKDDNEILEELHELLA